MDVIKKLKKLEISAVSDALDQFGIKGGCTLIPRSKANKIVGRAFTVKFKKVKGGVIAKAADYIDEVKEGEVVVLDNNGDETCTVWGDILTEAAIMKKIAGTIIFGACRDLTKISHSTYPIFSKSVFMKTGKNRVALDFIQKEILIGNVIVRPGDYIMGDDSGVIVAPAEIIEKIIDKAEEITKKEDSIIKAIKKGVKLKEARAMYGYNATPFKKKNGND